MPKLKLNIGDTALNKLTGKKGIIIPRPFFQPTSDVWVAYEGSKHAEEIYRNEAKNFVVVGRETLVADSRCLCNGNGKGRRCIFLQVEGMMCGRIFGYWNATTAKENAGLFEPVSLYPDCKEEVINQT